MEKERGVNFINVSDIVNEKTGKTWKEENLEKEHEIPLKTLVEVEGSGLRLYVVKYMRDCDETPLYGLSHNYDWGKINNGEILQYVPSLDEDQDFINKSNRHFSIMERGALDANYGARSLKVIKTAEETAKDYE